MSSMRSRRILNELRNIDKDLKDTNIFVSYDTSNISELKAMIIGPDDTIYANGFYLFTIKIPDNYPTYPPIFTVMNQFKQPYIRFNPNLYTNEGGKVCISTLNTTSRSEENSWNSTIKISNILIQILAQLNNNPLTNIAEYSYKTINDPDVINYNLLVWFYNLKFCTSYILNNINKEYKGFNKFKSIIIKHLKKSKQNYLKSIEKKRNYDKQKISSLYNMTDIIDLKSLRKIIKNI